MEFVFAIDKMRQICYNSRVMTGIQIVFRISFQVSLTYKVGGTLDLQRLRGKHFSFTTFVATKEVMPMEYIGYAVVLIIVYAIIHEIKK